MIVRPYIARMPMDLDITATNESPQTWESVSERMPELLTTLKSGELLHRDPRGQLPQVPDRGIYVFYHGDKPIYVGRTDRMRQRLQEHGRDKATHNQAALAFLMAEKKAGKKEIVRGSRTRKEFANDEKFKPIFSKSKAEVRQMKIRVVKITDPIEQAVFEVYAALELGTTREQGGYNDFENR